MMFLLIALPASVFVGPARRAWVWCSRGCDVWWWDVLETLEMVWFMKRGAGGLWWTQGAGDESG